MRIGEHTRGGRRAGAFVIVAALCVALLAACAQSHASGPLSPTTTGPTAAPAYTATPAPPAGTGWRTAGPADLQSISFAPGDPLTAYTCLNRGSAQSGPLTFGVSHDGGQTWAFHTTTIPATRCQMAVSPGDASSVAIVASGAICDGDACDAAPYAVYRSRDAGANWSGPVVPVGGLRDWGYTAWLAWVGGTLFVGSNGDSVSENAGDAQPLIAASVNGAPLTSVGGATLSQQAGMRLAGLLPLGASVIVELNASSSLGTSTYLQVDAAAGALTPLNYHYLNSSVVALAASADGKTLIGQAASYSPPPAPAAPLLISTDNGVAWRALPAFPQAQNCCYERFIAGSADGSIVAEIATYQFAQRLLVSFGVFELRPGAKSWDYVAPPPPSDSGIITISSDASGRPVAVWAASVSSGLPYHPLA